MDRRYTQSRNQKPVLPPMPPSVDQEIFPPGFSISDSTLPEYRDQLRRYLPRLMKNPNDEEAREELNKLHDLLIRVRITDPYGQQRAVPTPLVELMVGSIPPERIVGKRQYQYHPQNKLMSLWRFAHGDHDYEDDHGARPIHYAALSGNIEVMKHCLHHGSVVLDRSTILREPVLAFAAHSGKVEAFDFVYTMAGWRAKGQIKARQTYGYSLLHAATMSGNCDMVKRVLDKGYVPLSVKSNSWNTPAHSAAESGLPSSVRCLNELGADFTAKNIYGETPLHRAVFSARLNTAEVIASECKVDVGETDGPGWRPTLLHAAAASSSLDCVNWVMRKYSQIPSTSSSASRIPELCFRDADRAPMPGLAAYEDFTQTVLHTAARDSRGDESIRLFDRFSESYLRWNSASIKGAVNSSMDTIFGPSTVTVPRESNPQYIPRLSQVVKQAIVDFALRPMSANATSASADPNKVIVERLQADLPKFELPDIKTVV